MNFEADPIQEDLDFNLPTPQQTIVVTNALDFLATLIDKSAKTSELMQSAVAAQDNTVTGWDAQSDDIVLPEENDESNHKIDEGGWDDEILVEEIKQEEEVK